MSHEKKIGLPAPAEETTKSQSDDLLLHINLRLKLDEVAEVEAVALRTTARLIPTPTDWELRELAKRIYEARRARDKVLDNKLFGEPAWDMLLALFYMPRQGHILSVSGLCHVSGVPPTTALNWQKLLTSEGLIERGPDEVDRRRQFIRLTEKGRALMQEYLCWLYAEAWPRPAS